MTISEVAMRMWPCWLAGFTMLLLIWKSEYKSILAVDIKAIGGFLKFMIGVIAIRYLLFPFLYGNMDPEVLKQMANFIPWQTTSMVFWEDAVFILPLILLAKNYGEKKWYKYLSTPLLIANMITFGSGHMYQGPIAAACLSMYIPIVMNIAKKYGAGTTMICHICYDMITLIALKLMVGL